MEVKILRLGEIKVVMDSRYAIKKNQMRKRRLSTELESINHQLEDSLHFIEHEVNEIQKNLEKHSESEEELDRVNLLKTKPDIFSNKNMADPRRRASSFTESSSGSVPKKPINLHEIKAKLHVRHDIESPVGHYITSPLVPSYARTRRMSLPANMWNSNDSLMDMRLSSGSNSPTIKGSNSSLKGSHDNLRRSRDNVTRSRDTSPEVEKYESQMRRLKRELNRRRPKTVKQLERVPLTTTEEKHVLKYLQEEEHKRLKEKRNAELFEGLRKCTYLRTNHEEELSVEEMLDRTPD